MTYFDDSINAAPVTEQNTDPVLPEERLVFELIGFERSEPDQWRQRGGIKWTFLTFLEDGKTPFVFQNEQYQMYRTTNVDAQGRPLFTIGTQAHEWAQALLGRQLGTDAHFNVSELRGKRMSSQIVWTNKKTKPGEKTATLASLRHVPVAGAAFSNGTAAPKPSASQVSADPSSDEIDRALLVSKIQKGVTRLTKLDSKAGKQAQAAVDASDLDTAPLEALSDLSDDISAAIRKALDE